MDACVEANLLTLKASQASTGEMREDIAENLGVNNTSKACKVR